MSNNRTTVDGKRLLIELIVMRRLKMAVHTQKHTKELHNVIPEGMVESKEPPR